MSENYYFYVGSYTESTSFTTVEPRENGITLFEFNRTTNSTKYIDDFGAGINPSFLTIHPSKKSLYSITEIDNGTITAFKIDPDSKKLTAMNTQSTNGSSPCHISIDQTEKYCFVANYDSGSVCVFALNSDGSLGNITGFAQHQGQGINPERQEGPHAHSFTISPENKYAIAADLGIDKVLVYKIEHLTGEISLQPELSVSLEPGAGPRHFDFHPNHKFAYVINELNSTITSLSYESNSGALTPINTISTVPESFSGINSTADIHVLQNGKFLYGSNRGHNTIFLAKIDQSTGSIEGINTFSTKGEIPRNFALTPDDDFLFAANQDSHSIIVYSVDKTTGNLTQTGEMINTPKPICIKFL